MSSTRILVNTDSCEVVYPQDHLNSGGAEQLPSDTDMTGIIKEGKEDSLTQQPSHRRSALGKWVDKELNKRIAYYAISPAEAHPREQEFEVKSDDVKKTTTSTLSIRQKCCRRFSLPTVPEMDEDEPLSPRPSLCAPGLHSMVRKWLSRAPGRRPSFTLH